MRQRCKIVYMLKYSYCALQTNICCKWNAKNKLKINRSRQVNGHCMANPPHAHRHAYYKCIILITNYYLFGKWFPLKIPKWQRCAIWWWPILKFSFTSLDVLENVFAVPSRIIVARRRRRQQRTSTSKLLTDRIGNINCANR